MTVNRGPGVAKNGSVGVTTLEHRLQLAGQYVENAPGVPRSGVLTQATAVLVAARSDMSYDIGPFQAVISRTASEGVYTPTLTGTTNVPTDDAPGTNSRWDLIYVKQNDVAKGDADNLAVVGVVKGTPAASPAKPTGSLPAGAMVLAEARIFAGTTATNGGSNTVSQVWRHTAARGGRVTIRNAAERAEMTAPAPGQEILRSDKNQVNAAGTLERWNGTSWDHFGHTEFTTPANLSATDTAWGMGVFSRDTARSTDDAFVTVNSTDTLRIRDAGLYSITVMVSFTTPIGGISWLSADGAYTTTMGAGLQNFVTTMPNVQLAANQVINPLLAHGSGSNRTFTSRVRITRIG